MKKLPLILAALFTMPVAHAQISLQTAVNLALKNSPKVHGAQADLDKAQAARGESKDAYVPVVSTTAGYGQSTGAPLGVPVIFSISAQSLLFSYSQKDYTRATESAVRAAELLLQMTQTDVAEDTIQTYLAVDNASERKKVLIEELGYADRLIAVTQDRIASGVDAKVEAPKSHKTATQIRFAALRVDDEVSAQTEHLATLTGLPSQGLKTDRSTIPMLGRPVPAAGPVVINDSAGVQAAFAAAQAKEYTALGDHRYLLRPQIALGGNYSRVATGLSSYSAYYPRYAGTADSPNSQNSLTFGLQFTVPLLDMAHRSKARQSAAEARRAFADAESQRGLFREGRAKLQNSAVELELRAELAREEREIASDQLETVRMQLAASSSSGQGPRLTPKDQLSAQLQERQGYVDVLNAELQLQQTQVTLLRQTDGLGTWVIGTGARPTGPIPGGSVAVPFPNTPGISGTAPAPGTITPTR